MPKELSRNERIKEASGYLRGTLADGLTDISTGAITEDDQQLVKFHGMYLQDDRDLRAERTKKIFTIVVCVILVLALGIPTIALSVLSM